MVEVSVWKAVVRVWAREIERATLPLQVGYCLDRKSLPQHTTRCVSHSWLAIIKGRGNIDINSTMATIHHRGDTSYLVPTYKWRQADCLIVIPVHNSVIIQVWCWWGIDKKTTHLQHTWSGTTTGFHQWVFFFWHSDCFTGSPSDFEALPEFEPPSPPWKYIEASNCCTSKMYHLYM